MKKLGKRVNVTKETVEAYVYCVCVGCSCSCYCYGVPGTLSSDISSGYYSNSSSNYTGNYYIHA